MQGLGVQLPEPCTPEVGISRVLRVWDSEPLLVDIYIYIYIYIYIRYNSGYKWVVVKLRVPFWTP